MKLYSHHAFCPKGTVAQSPEGHEQNRAFCIFGLVAMDAIDNGLASASFHGKTGWYPPRYSKPRSVSERLHNTAEPKRQNGQQWIISTRHAHLVLESEWSGGKEPLCSLAP